MDEFVDFLRGRGIPNLTIQEFIDENIDPAAVIVMPEENLKRILPKLGDRIAIKDYCKKQLVPKKQSLIDRLKLKMSTSSTNNTQNVKLNKKVKTTRLIEVGWVCSMDGETYVQVRKLQGGGTRQIEIEKSATVQTVHQRALKLFFPIGKSTKGYLADFQTKMVDFSLQPLDDVLTVEDYFSCTALTKLRFYLASKFIGETSPQAKRKKSCQISSLASRNINFSHDEGIYSTNEESRPLSNEANTESNEYSTLLLNQESNEESTLVSNENYYPKAIRFEEDNSKTEDSSTRSTWNYPSTSETTEVMIQTESSDSIPTNDFTFLVNSILDNCTTQPSSSMADANVELVNLPQTISLILENLQEHINTQNASQFNVYREDIFGCCVRAMRRPGFDPFNKISVKFSDVEGTSEGAVDEGGPCREMFRLSLSWLKDSAMFCGPHKKNLTLCGNSLHKNLYFEAGRLIALSLVHGGPGPNFFSETLFSLLCDHDPIPTLEDIDRDTMDKIVQFQNAKNLDELQTVISDSEIFSLAGFPTIIKEGERDKIVQGTLKFFAVDRIREPLRQLIEGLKTCGLYELLTQYHVSFKDLFCSEVALCSKIVEELFLIVYTEPGTNTRSTENRVISYFRDYVLDLECDPTNIVTLSDLLVFSTGVDCPPPLGFPSRPQITFLHENPSRFPMANTCALQLKLPVNHRSYEEFKTDMDYAIGNAKTFGFA